MTSLDLGRFKKFKTRRKANRVVVYWLDKMTGQLITLPAPKEVRA